ncbi:MAG: beta-propeller fold lactonase family protein [Gammaproteobacteria bacterium]|nr:beta-propeller fold lactonase family protein [Gammaproteobacteria bacterium]MBU4280587.1 beta-propeller fold lactonase family protein [Gammaproteobacteria bacterium]MBU4323695.1 beta-propeller fold lactonase family protein [Gammaproteobacteria bacterium]
MQRHRSFNPETPVKPQFSAWTQALVSAVLLAGSLSVHAADRKIFVANEGAGTVSVINAETFKLTRHIAVGAGAHNVQVSPDGKLAWVTNNGTPKSAAAGMAHAGMSTAEHGAMSQAGEVWSIDTETDEVVARVVVGKHPAHVVVSADGLWAYVTNGGDNTLSVVDTKSLKVVDTIPTGEFPHGIRLSPDGKQAYVANLKGGTVSVIDTESRKEISQIPVGKGPAQVGFTSDSRLAFVSLSQEASVAVIDPVSRKVIRKVRVGNVPIQLYATPDNRFLFVANQGSRKSPGNTVSEIDLSTFSTQRIQTGIGAHGVVVGNDGRHAYVTNLYANTVSVIDVRSRKSVATVAVGVGPNGISVSP